MVQAVDRRAKTAKSVLRGWGLVPGPIPGLTHAAYSEARRPSCPRTNPRHAYTRFPSELSALAAAHPKVDPCANREAGWRYARRCAVRSRTGSRSSEGDHTGAQWRAGAWIGGKSGGHKLVRLRAGIHTHGDNMRRDGEDLSATTRTIEGRDRSGSRVLRGLHRRARLAGTPDHQTRPALLRPCARAGEVARAGGATGDRIGHGNDPPKRVESIRGGLRRVRQERRA
jgi:hypothetical protein